MALYTAHDYGDLSEEFFLDSHTHLFQGVHDFAAVPAPPAPGVVVTWANKVFDPGGPGVGVWVVWDTTPDPDPAGTSYPDPYLTGFGGCSGYRTHPRYA